MVGVWNSSANHNLRKAYAEAARIERRKERQKQKARQVKQVCSDCHAVVFVSRWQLKNHTRLRCEKCGGPLNKPSQA